MRKYIFSQKAVLSLVTLAILVTGCEKRGDTGLFVPAPCPIEVPDGVLESGKFSFGYMKVPELHAYPDGKTIELAVAIHKCQGESATLEPLVLITGGPGMSDIDTFVPELFGDLGTLFLDNRDVVVIELRGLKYAKPNLILPEIDNLQLYLSDKSLSVEESLALYMDSLQGAYDRLEREGVNLSAYNDYEIANDIAYVMEQLHYDTFSVFGSSFGTLVAQHLLLNHSEKLASVTMNALVDINRALPGMHTNSIRALENIFNACENDPELSKAYPNLKNRFLATLARLNERPDTLEITYGKTGALYRVPLNGNKLSVWLFGNMYWDAQIPATLDRILSGDYSQIIEQPGMIFPLEDFSYGLSLSIILAEYSNFEADDIPLNNEYADYVKGCGLMPFSPYFLNRAREVWKVNDIQNKNIRLVSDVPALVFSGALDHVCPPNYARDLSASLEHSYVYVFPGIAHSPIDAGACGIMMMKEFVDHPAKAPDSSCLQDFSEGFNLPD
ncbi:MAG TPA: alpha/beta fold hydrolase [Robiginitalea sp.]|nr:alpha/beta fold hydrolase [Robiginitalea sp.]